MKYQFNSWFFKRKKNKEMNEQEKQVGLRCHLVQVGHCQPAALIGRTGKKIWLIIVGLSKAGSLFCSSFKKQENRTASKKEGNVVGFVDFNTRV